jgi:hypothetical protein
MVAATVYAQVRLLGPHGWAGYGTAWSGLARCG